jgi:hypothetical protein
MSLTPDCDRLRVHKSQNGYMLAKDNWSDEHQQYRESKSWVFSDTSTLIDHLIEETAGVSTR